MNRKLAVILIPTVAGLAFWVVNSLLSTLMYPHDQLPRAICALLILVAGVALSLYFVRVLAGQKSAEDAARQLVAENERLNSVVAELQKKQSVLAADVDVLRKALSEAEEKLDVLGAVLVIVDADGVVKFVNRKACQVLGFGRDDIVGRKFFENFVPTSVRTFARNEAKKMLSGDAGAEREYTGLLVDRNGTERLIGWHHSVLKDEHGRAGAILSVGDDATSRTESEAQETELRERQTRARRMECIALFAGGIAGRMSEVLAKIRQIQAPGDGTVVPGAPEADGERRDVIAATIRDGDGLVAQLNGVAGTAVADHADVNLNGVVRACLNSTRFSELREANLSVDIKTDLAADLLPVSGSEEMLTTAVYGLVARAVASLPDGGKIVISTKNLHVGEGLVKYETIPPGDYAVVWVVDNGKSVDDRCLDRIFEPFGCPDQSKAGPLSLSLTYGVIKAHKGYVNVKSEDGVGTEFALCIPVTRKNAGTDEKDSGLPRGTENILVVDDSEQERAVAKRFLEKLGYKVTVAATGREALKFFKEGTSGKSPFDVMLLDMILGGDLDGLDTYRETVKMYPGQKCIIVSGYAQSERSQEAAVLGASQFLSKPFTLEGLARSIRDELDEES